MFEPDAQDELGWSENADQSADPAQPAVQSPSDAPDQPDESGIGFDRSLALYWGAVFSIAAAVMLLVIPWIARNTSGAICIGDTANSSCGLANVAIHTVVFVVLVVYAVTIALWVVRAKPRDACWSSRSLLSGCGSSA